MKLRLPWQPKDNYFVLLGFILAVELIGILGSLVTAPAIPAWYAGLSKPFFSPPNWLFGPVWTLLYAMMGASAYLVWRRSQFKQKTHPFWKMFGIQLFLNWLWSILFFGFRSPGLAFLGILTLWYFIYQTILVGQRFDRRVAYLLYPYLAWVSFASLLNLAIIVLN